MVMMIRIRASLTIRYLGGAAGHGMVWMAGVCWGFPCCLRKIELVPRFCFRRCLDASKQTLIDMLVEKSSF